MEETAAAAAATAHGKCVCRFVCVRVYATFERELMVCSKVALRTQQWDQRRLICCKMLPVAVILLDFFLVALVSFR